MNETQDTICAWTYATFGRKGSNARCAARANEEMAELLRKLTVDDNHPDAMEEVADIVIVLCKIADRYGVEIWKAVEEKMAINRKREWRLTDEGHGHHL